jgi:hypothetical protein
MKAITLASLVYIATTGSASVIQTRQLAGLFGGKLTAPERIVDVQPRVRQDAKRQQVRFGPFTLPAMKDKVAGHGGLLEMLNKPMDPNGYIISLTVKDGICKDCTVLAGKADITVEDGRRADIVDGIYLHHILGLSTSSPSTALLTNRSYQSGQKASLVRSILSQKC